MLGHSLTPSDVDRITGTFFVEGEGRSRLLSSFWTLLVLSAVIASAGIIGDATATVIGAMIVAPLMRPILGTAAAIVLARRRQVVINLGLTLGGALTVVAVAFLLGLATPVDVVAATNGQVAGRVHPRLIDLVAALATGVVGVFAIVRSDVSDTLPGVAIAISLVPPLAVVGLTLESGAAHEAAGALLLFGTNVAAIIATGTLVLLVAGFRDAAGAAGGTVGELTGRTLAIVAASVVLIVAPLAHGSREVVRQQSVIGAVQPVAQAWAERSGWRVSDIAVLPGTVRVVLVGAAPAPDPAGLRTELDRAGVSDLALDVTLLDGVSRLLPAGG